MNSCLFCVGSFAYKTAIAKTNLGFAHQMQVRYRGRTITKKYRVPHFDRRLFLELAKPIYPVEEVNTSEKCKAKFQFGFRDTLSEYEQFLVTQCRRLFAENTLVAVCQRNSMKQRTIRQLRLQMRAKDLNLESRFDNDIVLHALEGTKWLQMAPLFVGPNIFVTSQEPDIANLVKVLKKVPQVILLGAVVNDRLMSRDQLLEAAQLPELPGLRAQLTHLLSSPTACTRRLLDAQQQELTRSLSRHSEEHKT